jgi:hypothetical protein
MSLARWLSGWRGRRGAAVMSPEEEDIQLAGVISVMIKNF